MNKENFNKSDRTRQALIEAAIELFASRGFEASSVREIASAANANIASIGYHFGGKDGLRRACAEHAADFLRSMTRRGFSRQEGLDLDRPEQARRALSGFVDTVVRGMVTEPRAERIVRFMLREIANPSDAFQIIYSAIVEPTHRRLCGIWASITGEDPESEAVRLGVFAIMGQVVYFRIGNTIVSRRMDWRRIGAEQAALIADEIVANLHSALDRHAALAANRATGRARS